MGRGGREVFSRAFKRRYGVRPPVYRQFGGRLSGEAAARCGDELEPAAAVRVFEDLATICDGCARQRAPELIAWLDGEGG